MRREYFPSGINPMPDISTFMHAYRELSTSAAREEPIDETVGEFAMRLGWPVDITTWVAQR